jgi:hypothetical protein
MPAVVIPDEGLPLSIDSSLGVDSGAFVTPKLILFSNDVTPDQATVFGDLIEPTFDGYAQVDLDPGLWAQSALAAGCIHYAWSGGTYSWNVVAGPLDTIYGWAWIDATAGKIKRIQRFDAPDIAAVVIGSPFTLPVTATLKAAEC